MCLCPCLVFVSGLNSFYFRLKLCFLDYSYRPIVFFKLGSESEVVAELVSFQAFAKVQVSRSLNVYSGAKDLIQLAFRSKSTYAAVAIAAETPCFTCQHSRL